MKTHYSLSICIPVYNGSHLLQNLLINIFGQQNFSDYEIIIGEDTPPEFAQEIAKTEKIIKSFKDPRVKYYKNEINLGYAVNLQKIVSRAKNDTLFLLAQDDILSADALKKTHDAFLLDSTVGVITRPYFWFDNDINTPVRVVYPYNKNQTKVISIFDGKHEFHKIFESVGQLSGLAYKRSLIDIPFNAECFRAHIYPFAGILRNHKCAFLNDYTVAVGIKDSQTRSISNIYDLSPTLSWLKMYRTVFDDDNYRDQLRWGREHILTNYIGLIQLKNYAKSGVLNREILILIRERPLNLLSFKFWFYVLITLLTPREILSKLVDIYKVKVNSNLIEPIKFNHNVIN